MNDIAEVQERVTYSARSGLLSREASPRGAALLVPVLVCLAGCDKRVDRPPLEIVVQNPGWHAIVWTPGLSEDVESPGTIVRSSNADSTVVVDFAKTGTAVMRIAAPFEEGWAPDRFLIVGKYGRQTLDESGWTTHVDRVGTVRVEDCDLLYRVFYIGPNAPATDFDSSTIAEAIRNLR